MALELAPLTDNAIAVLRKRYLVREGERVVETPAEMFERVAHHVAAAEARWGARPAEVTAIAHRFAQWMASLEFLPNSPTLMNAGRPLGQLAACFVVPVADSTRDIFEAVRWAAEIQKTGGGTGFAFSRLRPAGDPVASTGGIAAGPVAFMQVFDVATEAIKQGGTRRGANMGILRIDHPDVLDFIAIKLDPARMRNFNLSLAVTDEFMDAAAHNRDYALRDPRTGAVVRRLHARAVLDLAANAAWTVGDPGLVFIDRINATQPTPALGEIEATNPCVTGDTRVWVEDRGLVPIQELVGSTPRIATWDGGRVVFRTATQVLSTGIRPVHRLSTVEGLQLRLTADHLVTTDRGDVAAAELIAGDRVRALVGLFADGPYRDREWVTVSEVALEGEAEVFDLTEPTTSHFFAGGLLTHNCGEQPLLPFESCTLGSINLGRFAKDGDVDWGRLTRAVRDAVLFLDDVIEVNHYPLPEIESATRATRKLGLGVMGWADLLIELGIPYDSDEARGLGGRIAETLERESLAASEELARVRGPFPAWQGSRWQLAGHAPLRNATTTTVAPTGTISIIAGCSSGIEPLYALAYERHVLDGAVLPEVNPAFRAAAEAQGLWSEALAARLAERGSIADLPGLSPATRALFATAHDVSVEGHVRMQAAFQRHVHAAVSKTINLAKDAAPADVRRAFQLAYDLGCKGITVYRDTSREGQVLVSGGAAAEAAAPRPACPECGAPLLIRDRCRMCRSCGWSVCQ
jgi:ribonucleoside-diphosphate reductase alpha chain